MNKVAVLNDTSAPGREITMRVGRLKPVVIDRIALLLGATLLCSSTLMMAQAGSLDPTFGSGGIVTTANTGQAVATAIQADGKILVAGLIANEPGVARYNTNGSLDSTFGKGGLVVINVNQPGPAFAVAVQADGKIVVGASGNLDLLVIRLHTNGNLDTSFGTGGIVEVEGAGELIIGLTSGGIAVLPGGKILVADDALARLLSNGQLDSGFGTGGVAPVITRAQALSLPPNGQILVASNPACSGRSGEMSVFSSGGVTRYNSNGSFDTTYGINGQAPSLGPASAIVSLSNNQLIVAGTLNSVPGNAAQGFDVVRQNSNGFIDTTFGTHGGVVTSFPGNAYAAALAVAVQSNGDIVAAGQTAVNNPLSGGEAASFALARYTANGQLDTTFGTGGLVTTAFGSNFAFVSALAIQADGKIVAVGNGGGDGGFTLARYLAQ